MEKGPFNRNWTRSLVSVEWRELFPQVLVVNEALSGSDHRPIVLLLEPVRGKQHFLFRFEAKWLLNQQCSKIINSSWNFPIRGSPMFSLTQKLKWCSANLSRWSKRQLTEGKQEMMWLQKQLEVINGNPMDENNKAKEEAIVSWIHQLWKAEEIHWKQRSRVQWLQEGDKNTRFFHLSTIQRRQRNYIHRLQRDDRSRTDNEDEIKHSITFYFKRVYKKSPTHGEDDIVNLLPNLVTP
ncbi:hypothetical protein P3X46_034379 [Hevea brasiliensis]|uniref:Endonuclease/exonuclease/phosphatase domain-containing protein n=1 Tax=Hevea brasiliensis TaxID=3981 RepID=A0ABQ9K912_HEVBR|nr:hypothetical protein P3X46_034379 [Hevea brasiliensis]